MKNKIPFIGLFCLLLSSAFAFSGCEIDLSHKHYLNDFGVCKSCLEDLTISLSPVNGQYVSDEVDCKTDNYTYFKFVANENAPVTIYLEEITATVEGYHLDLYEENPLCASPYILERDYEAERNHENKSFYCANALTQGNTYFVRVKASVAGKIKLTIRFDAVG